MKKFARIALTACLLLGIAAQANAVDFKIKGRWISLFDYGQNGNMTGGNGSTGYAKGFDNFEALQRWRIQLDAVASENLSGTVHFEIGSTAGARPPQAVSWDLTPTWSASSMPISTGVSRRPI